MGTRSLTLFQDYSADGNLQEIVVLYRQMDGYPTGHGQELKNFLTPFILVNGIVSPIEGKKIANGMSCLAAQTIAHFKTDVGGFYLYQAWTRNCDEEYIYTIYPNVTGKGVNIKVEAVQCDGRVKMLYDGPVKKFYPKKAEKIARQS
jgi:hypothetical protein